MKKLLVLILFFGSLCAADPFLPLGGETISYPDSYHIIQLENELFMVHAFVDEIGKSDYKVYNFPATINAAGLYQLAGNITKEITINTNNVTLAMNGYSISTGSNGIVISSGIKNVTISDGTVKNVTTDGIQINSGCRAIRITDVQIQGAILGLHATGVTNTIIRNCEFTQNTTGLELSSCSNFVIEQCVALQNKNAGFCLLTSTTCCLKDCSALSTGQGNTNLTNQTICGFVSSNGYGNIFERCIVNSTQALSVIDSDSIIAGIALRGSERCSKIIECESANATTSPSGVTVPYGIYLENSLDANLTLTTVEDAAPSLSIDWSPDGNYLAVALYDIDSTGALFIYEYNYVTNQLKEVAFYSTTNLAVGAVAWHPTGQYLAISQGQLTLVGTARTEVVNGTGITQILFFDTSSKKLQLKSEVSATDYLGVSFDWSSDGRYLVSCDNDIFTGAALLGDPDGTGNVRLYSFDAVSEQLVQEDSISLSPLAGQAVRWRPGNKFVAVTSGKYHRTGSPILRIYAFNSVNKTISSVSSVTFSGAQFSFGLDWSADGNYIAVANKRILTIYSVNNSGQLSSAIATITFLPANGSSLIRSIHWSFSGNNYIVVVGSRDSSGTFSTGPFSPTIAGGSAINVFEFDRNSTLTKIADGVNALPALSNLFIFQSVRVSPDGSLFAVASGFTDFPPINIFEGFSFPSKNVIIGNTVYCNSGGRVPSGVGISGSSIQNLIIANTAYNNPLLRQGSGGQAPISSNYQFVTNVFNQLFGQGPTPVQNISIDGPVTTPMDIALVAQEVESKLDGIQASINALLP